MRHSAIRPSAPPLASSHGSAAVDPPNFVLPPSVAWPAGLGGAVAKATVCTPSRWYVRAASSRSCFRKSKMRTVPSQPAVAASLASCRTAT